MAGKFDKYLTYTDETLHLNIFSSILVNIFSSILVDEEARQCS